jgi:hypothetical protein
VTPGRGWLAAVSLIRARDQGSLIRAHWSVGKP